MLAVISSSASHQHQTGSLHPDQQLRLDAINDQLIASGIDYVCRHYDAPAATVSQIERAHAPGYVGQIEAALPSEGQAWLEEDTVVSAGSFVAAQHAAGAGILGVDLLMRDEASPVFCMIRPPGHHAERATSKGFCIFSNAAIAVRHAVEEHGLSRVAVIDFDAHHCNGTQDILGGDDRVLICSSFQHPFYPFGGVDDAPGNLLSLPLEAGATGDEFRKKAAELWFPALDKFSPELIVVSAGFDAHVLDDMSELNFTEDDFHWISRQIAVLARARAKNRVLSILEGGYEPRSLARSAVAHLNGLLA